MGGEKMIILDVNKLSKSYGVEELFNDVSFSLNEGESLAIVGPNGCGKSTILKIIAGIENCDSGVVSIKKGSKVAYLDQMGSVNNDSRTVYEILSDSFEEINKISKLLKELLFKTSLILLDHSLFIVNLIFLLFSA